MGGIADNERVGCQNLSNSKLGSLWHSDTQKLSSYFPLFEALSDRIREERNNWLLQNYSAALDLVFCREITCLGAVKIVWPPDHEWGQTNFIISVDGVNFRFHEEKHPTLSKNSELFDHKSNGPGLSYELALDVWKSRLVWAKQKPITKDNDQKFFARPGGLRSKIPDGKKAIADRGYRGKGGDAKIATPNTFDHPLLREFKARARMRQESFNQRIQRIFELPLAQFMRTAHAHTVV